MIFDEGFKIVNQMKPGMNRVFTEEEMKACPHLRAKAAPVPESPFKEKITIQSETENSAYKSTAEEQESFCPVRAPKRAGEAKPTDDDSDSDDEPKGGCPMMSFKGRLIREENKPRTLHS